MVPAGNKAKRLSSVNHTTKTIHDDDDDDDDDHHHHHHHHHQLWVKIKATVDNLGPAKTIKQGKDKCEILKTLIKELKKATKRLLLRQFFRPYFTQFDEILGCKDVMSLSEKTKVSANFISDNDINANSDSV